MVLLKKKFKADKTVFKDLPNMLMGHLHTLLDVLCPPAMGDKAETMMLLVGLSNISTPQFSFALYPHDVVLRKSLLNFHSPYTHYVGQRTNVRELDSFC